jgi:hypothetical protein
MSRISGIARRSTSIVSWKMFDAIGLAGVLLGLARLVWLAFRGWSVLLLASAAALLAAAFAGEPLLAHWTQAFIGSAAHFLAQFFPLFLLGALFGKLMEDSGSVAAIVCWMTKRLGADRAMLAVARPALRSGDLGRPLEAPRRVEFGGGLISLVERLVDGEHRLLLHRASTLQVALARRSVSG